MKLIECVNAYSALLELIRGEWGYDTAYTFMLLKKALEPHVEFFIDKEKELVALYAKKKADGGIEYTDKGGFYFADPLKASEYTAKHRELEATVADISWAKKKLPPPEKIRPCHLEALMSFIEFNGGGESGI